jgi:hypothetical protein
LDQAKEDTMSIWMLAVFAAAMLAAVASLAGPPACSSVAAPTLVVTATIFLVGVVRRGIREPVV